MRGLFVYGWMHDARIEVGGNILHAVTHEPPYFHIGGRLFLPAALLESGFFQAQNSGGLSFGKEFNGWIFRGQGNTLGYTFHVHF